MISFRSTCNTRFLSQKNTAKWRAPGIGKQMGPGMALGLHWHVKPVCVLTGGVGFHVEKPTKKPGMTWPCLYPLVAMETAWNSQCQMETSSHLQGLNPQNVYLIKMCSNLKRLEVAAPTHKKKLLLSILLAVQNRDPYFMVYEIIPT